MTKNLPEHVFRRKKTITIEYDGQTMEFTLTAPSASDREAALEEARRAQTEAGKQILAAAGTIRAIYMLQDSMVLAEAAVDSEHEQIKAQAASTLVDDSPEYDERLAAKTEEFKNKRRSELLMLGKEKLADKLTQYEVSKQLEIIWLGAIYCGLLAQILEDEAGRPMFDSVAELKSALPLEVLEKLYEAMLEFTYERGNAQVFPKPHTFRE